MKTVIKRLRELAAGAMPKNTDCGICDEFAGTVVGKGASQTICDLAIGWDKHSGNIDLPIFDRDDKVHTTVGKQYCIDNLWEGRQGELRRELCTYIADKLEAQGYEKMKTVEIDGVSLTEEQVMQAYKKLQASERCKKGYAVYGDGDTRRNSGHDYYNNFNIYPTAELAWKASKLIHESNKLIYACLLEDPDYEPDWDNITKAKHSVYLSALDGIYKPDYTRRYKGYAAHVSTTEKAKEVAKRMNEWRDL